MYNAKILLDSVTTAGERLVTLEATYPRFVHSELMTHRVFSRNAASSRAIPIEKQIQRVMDDPVTPVWWGKNQSGMQARKELTGFDRETAEKDWLTARNYAVGIAHALLGDGLHKQLTSRILEPWMWITTIITATEWQNFFTLRCHPDAQPELRHVAEMMREAYENSTPQLLQDGEWHLPLVTNYDESHLRADNCPTMDLVRISTGRCCRVSYLTHEGKRDPNKDIALHDQEASRAHWSPFEHQAQAHAGMPACGNFTGGFLQYRKTFEGEDGRG